MRFLDLKEIEVELRSIANGTSMRPADPTERVPTICGKPIFAYFDDLADRLEKIREPLDARPQIGDRCIISERWEAVITAYTVRASGQTEYQLEWIGDGELKSDWLTLERMRLLGVKLSRDGKEVWL